MAFLRAIFLAFACLFVIPVLAITQSGQIAYRDGRFVGFSVAIDEKVPKHLCSLTINKLKVR